MFVQKQFHDLRVGDVFSFDNSGCARNYKVDDDNYIDLHQADPTFHDRLIMYYAEDGLHGHLANHEIIWLVIE